MIRADAALFLGMTRAIHRTVRAAAAAGGFAFFSIPHHAADDRCDNGDQSRADEDGCDILRDPCQHFHTSRLLAYLDGLCQLGGFLL